MLLAVDVGNTNTVFGIYDGERLLAHFRLQTLPARTADEIAVLLKELCALEDIDLRAIDDCIVATVVPPALLPIERLCERLWDLHPVVVGPGIRTGMPVLYDNPREVGADRIVNAVAAYERFHDACIIVDFGTATTLDVVTPRGEYLGGAIVPGITIAAEALYQAASKLPRVEIVRPPKVIGRNTVHSMQSGLVFGYAGLVDSLVERMAAELEGRPRVIATGGLAPLIAKESRTIEASDELLTLRGLKILFERNRTSRVEPGGGGEGGVNEDVRQQGHS